jgi:hypothetical protein
MTFVCPRYRSGLEVSVTAMARESGVFDLDLGLDLGGGKSERESCPHDMRNRSRPRNNSPSPYPFPDGASISPFLSFSVSSSA